MRVKTLKGLNDMQVRKQNTPRHRFGSERQYEYMKDIATANYYDFMIPFEDDLEKEAAYGSRVWSQETEMTPEELLVAAVVGQAVVDFLTIVSAGGRYSGLRAMRQMRERDHTVLAELTQKEARDLAMLRDIRDFLTRNPITEPVYYELRDQLETAREPEYVLRDVKLSYGRFISRIGKTGMMRQRRKCENGQG